MESKDLVGKYIFNEKYGTLCIISKVYDEFVSIEQINTYKPKEEIIHISAIGNGINQYRLIDNRELEELKIKYKIDYYKELEMLYSNGDMEIKTDGLSPIEPSKNADIYLLNFYGPREIDEFEDVLDELCFSNLGESFSESQTNWSVPQKAKVGDIVVFMCANTAKAKMSHVCAQVKDEYGKDSPVYELAIAERKFYEKYSGHIVGWGVLTGEPDYYSYGETMGYADVNINEKFIPPIPYIDVKDLFKLNAYGSVTRLTIQQWNDIKSITESRNKAPKINKVDTKKEKMSDKTEPVEKMLKVGDAFSFSKKLDYLIPYFGVNSYKTALYPETDGNLPIVSKTGEQIGTYFIWSANENPNDSGCQNILNPDGTKLVEIMPESFVPPESEGKGRPEPDLRVVFTKSKDTGKWMFRGVFKAIFDTKIKGPKRYANIYFRVATEIAIKQDSTKAIRLLNLYSAESFKG